MQPVRILHVHSTFALGGKEARAVRLMNAFGDAAVHTVLSGVPGALGAREAIAQEVVAAFPDEHPALTGYPSLGRYRAIARYMRGFDLVLTYNWGAVDAVMARRLFARALDLPPLVHHEDGFNADEVERQKRARILFRRLALPAARALVVPSERLERIALATWRQPRARVRRIANGIAIERYGPPDPVLTAGWREGGAPVIGTLAGLRAVKNLPRLVRAFAASDAPGRLVIVGEGPERGAILAEAERCGVADRLVLPGFLAEPHLYVGAFDIFALSSDSEQFPISLVEAMAAGLPAVAPAVGDVSAMVAPANRPFIAAPGDERALAAAIAALARDGALRRTVGAANRERALSHFSEAAMISEYRSVYAAAMGREGALG